MTDAYQRDLAYVHDVGFGDFAGQVGGYVLELLESSEIRDGTVVDLGCGSGIWARTLVEAGYSVRGVDISAEMIRMARRRVPEGDFEVGSFRDCDLGPCRAVTAMGEPLAYLFDPGNTKRALFSVFRKVYRALVPGGLFVFDLREPGTAPEGSYELFREGEDWAILCRVEEDGRGRLTRHLTTFRRSGKTYRRETEVHRLRLYRASEIVAELRRIGFKARVVRAFGDLKLAGSHAGFVARRPS